MKKTNLLIIAIFLAANLISLSFLTVSSFSQGQETINFTTYYPSPSGVYKTLRLYPHHDNVPDTACPNRGEMYYDDTTNLLYLCSGDTSPTWKSTTGNWSLSVNNLYANNINWNVGIGTTSPTAKLQVEGGNLVVSGTGQFNGGALSLSGAGTGILTSAGPVTTWGGNDFKAYSDSGTTQTVQIKGGSGNSYINSGNVGIGTTAPSQKLEVAGQVKIGSVNPYILPQADGTSGQTLVTDGSGNVGWQTAAALPPSSDPARATAMGWSPGFSCTGFQLYWGQMTCPCGCSPCESGEAATCVYGASSTSPGTFYTCGCYKY